MSEPTPPFRVIRTDKPYRRTKHGILLDGLKRRHTRLLERPEVKDWSTDEISCLFALAEARALKNNNKKTAFHTIDGEEYFYSAMNGAELLVRWRCAYCTKSIVSKIGDPVSLACVRCKHRIEHDDGPLIASSLDFTNHCKAAMLRRKGYILRYIKKNRRPNQ